LKYFEEKVRQKEQNIRDSDVFDNAKFFKFVEVLSSCGTTSNYSGGIKTDYNLIGQITAMLPRTFFLDSPDDLMDGVGKGKTKC